MAFLTLKGVRGYLNNQTFFSLVEENVKTLPLFEDEDKVINLNSQFLELVERDGVYRTSPYHRSNTHETLQFCSEVLLRDQEIWAENLERLKIDGSH